MENQSNSSQNSENNTNVLKDIEVLAEFIGVYCQHHHSDQSVHWSSIPELGDIKIKGWDKICSHCNNLLAYSIERRVRCPYDPKPSCKKCPAHCYKKEYRDIIKDVMKFSGMHSIKKGNLRLLKKYFL